MNVPSLTGVRGVAALWVVLFHIQLFGKEFGLPALAGTPILRAGWTGVDLFFVLSGFVLMLVHERDFPRLDWAPLLRFAWLRILRVYPLATVVLLLIVVLTLIDRTFAANWAIGSIPHNLTPSAFWRTLLLANRWWLPTDGDWNQPEWSLSAEILGYAAFPFVAMLATRLNNRWLLAILALACLLYPTAFGYFYKQKPFNDDIFWGAVPRMAGAFAGGMLLARLHKLTPEASRPLQGWLATLGLAGVIVILLLPAHYVGAVTPCFGLLVYGLAANRGLANRLFASPLAVWLGLVSFPLYLVHVTALNWLRFGFHEDAAGNTERVLGLGLTLGFVFCLAWLLHIYVERPSHRFARITSPFWRGRAKRNSTAPLPPSGSAVGN
jgi:peptidoglycan/LPS O-acetylase OafA/YrhL